MTTTINHTTLFSGLSSALDRRAKLTPAIADVSADVKPAVDRSSPEFWNLALAQESTTFVLLHKLNPLVATCGCSNKVYDARSLVRLSASELKSHLPQLFGADGTFNELSTPVALGSTWNDGSMVCAVDLSGIAPDAVNALSLLSPRLPTACGAAGYCPAGGCQASTSGDGAQAHSSPPASAAIRDANTSASSGGPVRYTFEDPRGLLFGPVLQGNAQPRVDRSIVGLLSSTGAAAAVATGGDLDPPALAWPLPFLDIALYGAARSILTWHEKTKYCGSCGKKMIATDGGSKRVCSGTLDKSCKESVYPRTDAVAITLVQSRDGSQCLLGRQAGFPPGFYSCLAGFVESGESLEEAAGREVREESGIVVHPASVRYVASQPWPLVRGAVFGQIMVGFCGTATADGDADIVVDKSELEDVRWFTKAEVASVIDGWYRPKTDAAASSAPAPVVVPGGHHLKVPGPFAIAHQLIKAWVRGEIPAPPQ